MRRKDCDTVIGVVLFIVLIDGGLAVGETVTVWPTAVVTQDEVTLADVCAFGGFTSERDQILSNTVVVSSPVAGGSKLVDLEQIQGALRQGGVNFARVLVVGAASCAVTRPSEDLVRRRAMYAVVRGGRTLREAVEAVFEKAAATWDGRVKLQFGRTDGPVLGLSEPQYSFEVRIRGGRVLGQLIDVDVNIRSDGRVVQSVPLIVSAMLTRGVVVAASPINAKGPIRERDVKIVERVFDDPTGITSVSMGEVVGLRAKRYIREGQMIDADDLETVPLVVRGELVDVVSRVGGIEIRTVAKAGGSGAMGEMVALRSGDRRDPAMVGYVIGRRRVSMTPPDDGLAVLSAGTRTMAMGGGR